MNNKTRMHDFVSNEIINRFLRRKISNSYIKEYGEDNKQFSILCSNCVAGVIYNDLRREFLTPTINLFIKPKDFVKLCKNYKYYFSIEPKPFQFSDNNYPIVQLDDIYIYCNHSKTFEDAIADWNRRKVKFDDKNLFVIMTERDGCTQKDIEEFDKLPIKSKVVFVHKPMPEIKSAIYVPGTELDGSRGHFVRSLTDYSNALKGERYLDRFDYIEFLKSGVIGLK